MRQDPAELARGPGPPLAPEDAADPSPRGGVEAELRRTHDLLRQREAELERLQRDFARVVTSDAWAIGVAVSSALARLPAPLRRVALAVGKAGHRGLGRLTRGSRPRASAPATVAAGPALALPPPLSLARKEALERLSVDVVVCIHDSLPEVEACLAALERSALPQQRLILVDDGSGAQTAAFLDGYVAVRPAVRLLRNGSAEGYTRAANRGLREAGADYIVLLNSDAVVTDGWLLHMLDCAEARPDLGIVGPLSNAAGWQSVPALRDSGGDWAANPLPDGFNPEHLAQLCRLQPAPAPIPVPLVNGFCFCLKRQVVEAVGLFDEAAFPEGYGEEDDYCLRAAGAGYACGVAPRAYVQHAKSASYSHERRRTLSRKGGAVLAARYGDARIRAEMARMAEDGSLAGVRAHLAARLAELHGPQADLSVLFVLPVKAGGGGAHSVMQEATGLRRLGVAARVAIPRALRSYYDLHYADLDREALLLPYDDAADLRAAAPDGAVVVATSYESVSLVAALVADRPKLLAAYYIQGYEPLLRRPGSAEWEEARRSYTAIPGMLRFAKTEWLCRTVEREHGAAVFKVLPSLDHGIYRPPERPRQEAPVKVAAMVRFGAPWRAPARTMAVLRRLKAEFNDRVELHTFGAALEHFARAGESADADMVHHGVLTRRGVADLLCEAAIFLDLSDWQSFGRTAVEAMACGAAVVVPAEGGATSFARHRLNALVVDTRSEPACIGAARELVLDTALRHRLQGAGPAAAAVYSVEAAALSELILFRAALAAR